MAANAARPTSMSCSARPEPTPIRPSNTPPTRIGNPPPSPVTAFCVAAAICGRTASGMASLGAPMANGRPKAMYEPVHGSAPDIAGQGKANPIACMLSLAMALRYSFDQGDEAARLEGAIEKVLADGARTGDLMGPEGGAPLSTPELGDVILAPLDAHP